MPKETDAKIIPLFKNREIETDSERYIDGDLEDLLSQEMAESISEVSHSLEQLWIANSVAAFKAEVRRIKEEVRRWPSGS